MNLTFSTSPLPLSLKKEREIWEREFNL